MKVGKAPLLSAEIPKEEILLLLDTWVPRSTSARASSLALPGSQLSGCELCIQNCWIATSAPLSCLVSASLLGPIPFPSLALSTLAG